MSAFFRNALIYRFTQPMPFDGAALQAALDAKQHREPATQELSTYGFVAPLDMGANSPLVQIVAGKRYVAQLITAKKTERIIPGSAVRDELKKRVGQIEADQLRKVYKKERDQIKDNIVQEFLPRAFLRSKVTTALILEDMIVVDAASPRAAEDLLSTLREAVGSLPVRPVTVKIAPSATMTDWLKTQKACADLHVLDECELRDTHEDGGTVRCKRQDLTGDEVQEHLSAGKQVTKLALGWKDQLAFTLDDNLAIKRLRFEDLLHEQAEQDGGDDAVAQFQASLAILAGTLLVFVPALLEALGGEDFPTGI